MKRTLSLAALGAPLLLMGSLLAATPSLAQMDAQVESALDGGGVGEQADGYLGFPRAPSAELRAKVEAINIKRRQGYTQATSNPG